MVRFRNNARITDIADVASYAILLGLAYCACFLAIGSPFEYGGACFATMLIWTAAHMGGVLFGMLHLPPLLGMLLSGMLLRNAAPATIDPLPTSWAKGFRAVALGTIFLRSGFELDIKMFKKVGPAAVRLLLIPGLVEAFVTGTIAHLLFGMPILLGFTLGFILKAVGPAIVIQTMFDVQQRGYGVEKGIPSIVVGAASFDDMVALTGYSLFSNLAIHSGGSSSSGSFIWKMFHGPMDLLLGITAGLVGALFCSFTAVWNTPMKRAGVAFLTALTLLFTLYHFDYTAGGALASIVLGLFTNMFWQNGLHFFWIKGRWISEPSKQYAHDVENWVGMFWRFFAQPLLFGIIGSMLNFRKLRGSIIPRSLIIIFSGIVVRMPTTFMAMTGAGLTVKERLFIAFAWTPKATVQAALAAAPLDAILKKGLKNLEDDGQEILTTAIFSILVCAPIGVMLIHHFAPKLLAKEGAAKDDAEPSQKDLEQATVHFSDLATTPRVDSQHIRMRTMMERLEDDLLLYIMGNESGLSPDTTDEGHASGTLKPSNVRHRTQSLPADLNMLADEKNHNQLHSALHLIDHKPVHDSDRESSEDRFRLGVDDGAVAAYLASIERLATVVVSQKNPENAAAYAEKLRDAVRSLRQKLTEGWEDHRSEQHQETARAFLRMARGVTSLPEVDKALETLQSHVQVNNRGQGSSADSDSPVQASNRGH